MDTAKVSAIERCLNDHEETLDFVAREAGVALESLAATETGVGLELLVTKRELLREAREELRRLNESDSLIEYQDECTRREGLSVTARDILIPSMVEDGYTQQEDGKWTEPPWTPPQQ